MLSLYSGALSLVVSSSPSVPFTVQRSGPAFMSGSSPAASLMAAMVDMVDDLHSVDAPKRFPLLTPLIDAAEAKWEGEMSRRIAGLEDQLAETQAEADALRAQLMASEAQVTDLTKTLEAREVELARLSQIEAKMVTLESALLQWKSKPLPFLLAFALRRDMSASVSTAVAFAAKACLFPFRAVGGLCRKIVRSTLLAILPGPKVTMTPEMVAKFKGVVSPTGTTPSNAQVTLPKDVKSWQIELVKDQFPDAKVLVA